MHKLHGPGMVLALDAYTKDCRDITIKKAMMFAESLINYFPSTKQYFFNWWTVLSMLLDVGPTWANEPKRKTHRVPLLPRPKKEVPVSSIKNLTTYVTLIKIAYLFCFSALFFP